MAVNDLLTIVEARSAVNLPAGDTSHDVDLKLFVSGISGRVDALCGPVVQRAVAGERYSGGKRRVLLEQTPASAVTSVSEWDGTTETVLTEETDAVKPSDAFMLDSEGVYSFVYRRAVGSDSVFPAGRRNVVIDYTAGRFATTADVGEQFKLTATSILRRIWKREQSSWSQTTDFFADTESPRPSMSFFRAVDPMVQELLADEMLPPVGL